MKLTIFGSLDNFAVESGETKKRFLTTVYPDSVLNFVRLNEKTSIQLLQTSGSKEVVKVIFPYLEVEVITKDFNNARKHFTLNNPVVESEGRRFLTCEDVYTLPDDLLRLFYDKNVRAASFNYLRQTIDIIGWTRGNDYNIDKSEFVFDGTLSKLIEDNGDSFYSYKKVLVDGDVAKNILSNIAFKQDLDDERKKRERGDNA